MPREKPKAVVAPSPRPSPPRKPRNEDVRAVEYLTEAQVDQLRRAAGRIGRHRHRDTSMILVGFRHGLRVSELVGVRTAHFDPSRKTLRVVRLKGSRSGTHDLSRAEVSALTKLVKSNRDPSANSFLFQSERGGGLTRSTFFKLLARAGLDCKPEVRVHPHMLRHGCGFHLINEGFTTRRVQDHLGHRSIQVTEKYTELAPDRERRKLWDD